MLRIGFLIVSLAAIGAAVVSVRAEQTQVRAELQRLDARRLEVRRRLWDQQVRLGELTAPKPTLWRARRWPLDLVAPDGRRWSDEEVVCNGE